MLPESVRNEEKAANRELCYQRVQGMRREQQTESYATRESSKQRAMPPESARDEERAANTVGGANRELCYQREQGMTKGRVGSVNREYK